MGYLLHNVQPIAWKPAFTWRLSKTPAFFSTLKTFLTMGMSGLISNPLYKSSTMAEDCLASCNRRFRRSAKAFVGLNIQVLLYKIGQMAADGFLIIVR